MMATIEADEFVQDSPSRNSIVTTPRERSGGIGALSEQQRAIAEVQASLTIAAARPRDEVRAVERIKNACQRVGVAQEAEYEYSRGGTDIAGASIRLLEVVAQQWQNLEWGFRELARYPGENGQSGESTVEAYAWDLQSNTKRKAQFTVRHIRDKKSGGTPVRDERDIYEVVASQAQRRVRTCLENIIPRDVVDLAREECRKTLKAKVDITAETLKQVIEHFAEFGVKKEHLEARLQRKLDTISPAQYLGLRRIYASLRDGVAEPAEFFDMTIGAEADAGKPKATVDHAKEKLRQQQAKKQAEQNGTNGNGANGNGNAAKGNGSNSAQSESHAEPQLDESNLSPRMLAAKDALAKATGINDIEGIASEEIDAAETDEEQALIRKWREEAKARVAEAKAHRGSRSNGH